MSIHGHFHRKVDNLVLDFSRFFHNSILSDSIYIYTYIYLHIYIYNSFLLLVFLISCCIYICQGPGVLVSSPNGRLHFANYHWAISLIKIIITPAFG